MTLSTVTEAPTGRWVSMYSRTARTTSPSTFPPEGDATATLTVPGPDHSGVT